MTEEPKVFRVENTDRRKELIEKVDNKETYVGQKVYGSDVEFFSPETGFVLLKGNKGHSPWKHYVRRAAACAKLSLGAKLELREFYYALGQTPHLIEAFSTLKPKGIYGAVLDSINALEILADVDRADFTMGNLSRGFIFDSHSVSYGDKIRKVAFTETIAREALNEWEIRNTQNIIVVEKNAAANRLVELGISELTNSCIVTVGGNFSRAIWALTNRFKDKKNILFICDGDVYGDDMLRTIEFGTMNSRHLPYKFPPTIWENIHLTGLFPSIAETLELPNDVAQKRPMSNPYAKKRLEFLERFDLIDQRDIETWRRNKTYELEALSVTYQNPSTGEPVGIGIYLLEYMRLMNIPIKPPLPPDDILKERFDDEARRELRREIDEEVEEQSPKRDLINVISQLTDERISEVINEIYDEFIYALEEVLEEVTAKEIKFHINKQFEDSPTRDTYNLREIAHKLKTTFEVKVKWNAEEITRRIREALVSYLRQLSEAGELWDAEIEFESIHNEEKLKDLYDIVLEKLGARSEDAEKVRGALAKRFNHE